MSTCKSNIISQKSADKFKRPSSLRNLVDGSLEAHKKDIKLYTSGHLNFNRFTKPLDKDHYAQKWRSTSESNIKPPPKSPVTARKKLEVMSDALFDFSFGSSGIIPDHTSVLSDPSIIAPLQPSRSQKDLENSILTKLEEEMLADGVEFPFAESEVAQTQMRIPTPPATGKKVLSYINPPISSKVCVEELKLPELMLTPLSSIAELPPSLKAVKDSTQNKYERKKFITTHLAGITRKDQFQKMVDFDENILQKSELLDRNVYDGHKAVAHLENKLVGKLLLLQMKQLPSGPSFERLQVYSEIWGDLVLDSSMFGWILGEIKTEYDNYLSHLLDMMKLDDHDDVLHSHRVIDDASTTSRSQKAEILFQEVDELEVSCRDALLKNYTLNQKIKESLRRIEEEKRQKVEEKEDTMKRLLPRRRKGLYTSSLAAVAVSRMSKGIKANIDKQIKTYRADIWKEIDNIRETKRQLREEYVPKTLHRNILHAIKDLEIEIQKLRQQHAFLSQHKQDLNNVLQNAFSVDKMSEEDSEIVWEMIES